MCCRIQHLKLWSRNQPTAASTLMFAHDARLEIAGAFSSISKKLSSNASIRKAYQSPSRNNMYTCIKLLNNRHQPLPPPHNGQQSSKNHPCDSAPPSRHASASGCHQAPLDQHPPVASKLWCWSTDSGPLASSD